MKKRGCFSRSPFWLDAAAAWIHPAHRCTSKSPTSAFGALVLTVLVYMKARNRTVIAFLVIIGLVSLGFSIFSRTERTAVEKQSATASGGSTIIQAGGNVTIINPGVQEETERARLRDESVHFQDRLAHKYPHGYALLGVANGKIVYEPYVEQFRIRADWENWRIMIKNEGSPTAIVVMSKLEIDGTGFENNTFELPYFDGVTINVFVVIWRGNPVYVYFEVIDTKQKTFVIGFSGEPLKP
jgi:hypothetical protein